MLDRAADTVRGYLDGEFFAGRAFSTLSPTAISKTVATADCPATNDTIINFGGEMVADFRDLRMYTGHVPSVDEIRAVAAVGRSWCA